MTQQAVRSYPGHWVASMLLEGKMGSHTEWVQLIAEQIGSKMQPDTAQYVNRFEVCSTSSPRKYLVSQRRSNGQWCCSCRGWTTHRRCKHLTDILSRMAAHAVLDEAAKTRPTSMPSSIVNMLASGRDAYSMLSGIK